MCLVLTSDLSLSEFIIHTSGLSLALPLDTRFGGVMVLCMATITLKDIPEDLHAQLKAEAEANLRSLNQEAIIRIQRSFDVADQFSTVAVNLLIDEAIASGPEREFTAEQIRQRLAETRTKTRRHIETQNRAA
jgi:hypothetical protein